MIVKEYDAACDERYLCAYGLNPEKTLYFDIESTGLNPARSHLYLIGAAVKKRSAKGENKEAAPWTVYQYFAQSSFEEREILSAFRELCGDCDTLVQFNGNRFDIPYLNGRAEALGMRLPLADMNPLDLYREIRPLKQMLGLKKLNQKAVEDFLGIVRQDRWTGGELIDVYRSYRDSRDNLTEAGRNRERLSMLLLHNLEDVLGMLKLTALLSYPLLIESLAPVIYDTLRNACGGSFLSASFRLEAPVPVPVQSCAGSRSEEAPAAWSVSAKGSEVQLRIPFLEGTLKHFFKDYRNYYYLPDEDQALHKSVASFVDAGHRRKASAENCYVKKQGLFLPQPEELFRPVFRAEYRDRLFWFEWDSQPQKDPDLFSSYIHLLVRTAFKTSSREFS